MGDERQAGIGAPIARHADSEVPYDQPYEDRKIARVSPATTRVAAPT